MPNGSFSGFKADPALFNDIQESLVALVGYPHHKSHEKGKRYENLYLIIQPANTAAGATVEEINVSETLEFLRRHKDKETFIPEWIATPNQERVDKLSEILKKWLQARMMKEAFNSIKDPRQFLANTRAGIKTPKLNEKFKFENFDLLAWEYVSKD